MSSDTLLSIANLLLPEVLVTYFELAKHEVIDEEIHFYFTELNSIPEEFEDFKSKLQTGKIELIDQSDNKELENMKNHIRKKYNL